jgi:hypothetical protein
MGKKSFRGGFDSLLGEQPRKKESIISPNEQEVTATFQFKSQQLNDIKAIAYWERKKIKDVLKEALLSYIEKYIKENGNIKPIKE